MNYKPSELIVNEDGSIFHLKLLPEDISDNILLVGDPGRVDLISGFFDSIEVEKHNREFKTITGSYNNRRITVISSGIGTDNIDIVVNELDALANIDMEKRENKEKFRQLNIIRIGTSGALQKDIPVGSFVASKKSVGFDNLLFFYNIITKNKKMEKALKKQLKWPKKQSFPYIVDGSEQLLDLFSEHVIQGINISAPGFYGPQGRQLRVPLAYPDANNKIENFEFNQHKVTNYEMESSAIYGLSQHLGHNALTICVIIANRIAKEYAGDYKPMMKKLITLVLDTLTKNQSE
ncbi:MAG: nucleoside phosphorylase [Bacteroidota bacterium]